MLTYDSLAKSSVTHGSFRLILAVQVQSVKDGMSPLPSFIRPSVSGTPPNSRVRSVFFLFHPSPLFFKVNVHCDLRNISGCPRGYISQRTVSWFCSIARLKKTVPTAPSGEGTTVHYFESHVFISILRIYFKFISFSQYSTSTALSVAIIQSFRFTLYNT